MDHGFVDLVVIGCCKADEKLYKAPAFSHLEPGDAVSIENSQLLQKVRDSVTISDTDSALPFILNRFGAKSLDDLQSITGVMGYFPSANS